MKFISSFSMIMVEAIKMKKQKYYLSLNSEETRLVLRSLIRMKNRLIAQGRYTDCVDELIAKIAPA
mgnify:CR=1 FL=1